MSVIGIPNKGGMYPVSEQNAPYNMSQNDVGLAVVIRTPGNVIFNSLSAIKRKVDFILVNGSGGVVTVIAPIRVNGAAQVASYPLPDTHSLAVSAYNGHTNWTATELA